MNFTLHLPNNYQRQPLPGRDEITADLRANPDKQTTRRLGWPAGPNCCLGRISLLQGRLTVTGNDGPDNEREDCLWDNPLKDELGNIGVFPPYVIIETDDGKNYNNLAHCNDAGLTFAQIATIIESVWYNSGPLLK